MLEWKNNSVISKEYDDIYFSVENGLKETEHVFIKGNNLEERFLSSEKFSILELGFGSGLNFLGVLNLWKKIHLNKSSLHFFSFEKSPLLLEDISKVLSFFPELKEEREDFLEKYHLIHNGFNLIPFLKYNVFLNLIVGEINDYLYNFEGKFDAIFLDGFSPSKNPSMWSLEVCLFLNRHSKENTSLSSFSVAKKVRDNLTRAGFDVFKGKGFGKKREMLKGQYREKIHFDDFKYKKIPYSKLNYQKPKSIVIIGGGISGCSLAYFLSKKNVEVTLVEKENEIASSGGSNQPCTISIPYINTDLTPASLYSIYAFSFCLKVLEEIKFDYKKSGILKFCNIEEKEKILKGAKKAKLSKDWLIEVNEDLIYRLTNINIKDNALFFPKAFSLNLKSLCNYLISKSNINLVLGKKVDFASFKNEYWSLYNLGKKFNTSNIMICANSYSFNEIFKSSFLKLNKVRGQVSYLGENSISKNLNTILYFQKYFTPALNGIHTLGSTYNEFSTKNVCKEDNIEMLKKLEEFFPFGFNLNLFKSSQVGFRCQSQDRTPIVGYFPDETFYTKHYKKFHYQKNTDFIPPRYLDNLYLSIGLGSRGVIYSFLNAVLIQSLIFNEPLPIDYSLYEALHPARFLMRNIKRS